MANQTEQRFVVQSLDYQIGRKGLGFAIDGSPLYG